MLPVESLRNFRKIDCIVVLLLAILLTLVTIPKTSFFLKLFAAAAFTAFTALLIRKIGAVVLFLLISSLMAYSTNTFGDFGASIIPVLAVAGVVFEAFYILIRAEIKSIPLNLIMANGLAAASIPWTMLLLAGSNPDKLVVAVWNFSLTAFFIGIAGAVVAFLAWYEVKNTKLIIRYEYAV